MIDTCVVHGKVDSPSWKITSRGNLCSNCYKGRTLQAGFITSQSQRVTQDREKNEDMLVQPFMANKPNPEFLKLYPDKAPDFYTKKELKKMGASKMKSRIK